MEKNQQNGNKQDRIEKYFSDETQITETPQRAISADVESHKRAGNPLAT